MDEISSMAYVLRVVRTSLLFDENWYKTTYQVKYLDGALHYLLVGYKLNYDPSPYFSAEEYYNRYPDVKEAGINPLVHFEINGVREKRFRDFIDIKKIKEDHPELCSELEGGFLRLRVTNRCNAKCRYCGVTQYFGEEKNHEMDKKWLFETCAPLYSKIRYLLLTGGDPNITAHSYEFMKFISENYPHITINNETNGIAFDKRMQELFADHFHKVHFSINASNADIYCKSCWDEGKHAYEKFMKI